MVIWLYLWIKRSIMGELKFYYTNLMALTRNYETTNRQSKLKTVVKNPH